MTHAWTNVSMRGGVDSNPTLENTPGIWYEYVFIHTTWDKYIQSHHAKFQRSSLKNLDVTDLQTFAIIWLQVISARHNKGNMEVFSNKFNGGS